MPWQALGDRRIAWDLLLVVVTIVVFAAVMVAMEYLGNA
jgi:hypothetical protein